MSTSIRDRSISKYLSAVFTLFDLTGLSYRYRMQTDQLTQQFWVEKLHLLPHPEGGFFRETYRSSDELTPSASLARFGGARACSTAIYYLLGRGDYSAFHRIKSDEMWHFYDGGPLEIHLLNGSGHNVLTLGRHIEKGQVLQAVVPAGVWFAARPRLESEYSLVGCTVSPGFDFRDFEMASRRQLEEEYPALASNLLEMFPPRVA